ncbi:MAG: undecaprenyldiphospho-muramoylpentapeptide beta-N-acetylglucosaminyltransferase [Bacilli bacterium]|nr:undecaprenyldiphospho-muramoylpentapeptide beta-N-acetylglucosaminyltransferase [Bacilli bacterium]
MRTIVCGGGTGGHIYPALAIINKIREEEPNSDILYIGTHNRMEKDIIPKYNISYMPLRMYGLKRSLSLSNIKTAYYYLNSIKRAKKVIKDFNPDIVIGVGGYITAPVIQAAKKLGHKTLIHEQNSIPGLSNRHLIKYADKIAISFESSKKYFKDQDKIVYTGNPCGDNALKSKKIDKKELGLTKEKKLVLIVMGSLGSLKVNEKITKMLPMFNDRDYEVLFVTGKEYYEEIKENVKCPNNVKIVPYIENMTRVMKATDLMVSRAGASTMSEIMSLEIPTIFIPSPYVTDNHQFKNASDLVNKGAALLVEEKELDSDKLVRTIDNILRDKIKYNKLKENLKGIGVKNSSDKIYRIIKNLTEEK